MTNYRHVSPDVMAAALKGTKQMIKTQHCPNCEAAEQKLHDFRQEVSDAVADAKFMIEAHCDEEASTLLNNRLSRFIIPDPLVEVLEGLGCYDAETDAADLRAALDARGLEIREKNDDQ